MFFLKKKSNENWQNEQEIPDELPSLAMEDAEKEKMRGMQGLQQNLQNTEQEKGFFSEMMSKIIEESKGLTKKKRSYKEELLSFDFLEEMRNYWESNRNALFLDAEEKRLEEELINDINELKELEKEWQQKRLEIIEIEEDIRIKEKDLKKKLSDFRNLIKRHSTESRAKRTRKK